MRPHDFASFFEAIHGYSPFPWQARLAREVSTSHEWPDRLSIPTGAGKTACIDIALFHWLVAAQEGNPWHAARRIAFVVDRRIIVDEAELRARKIVEAIERASEGILARARSLLHEGGGQGIEILALRGGTTRERNSVRDPLSVAILLSTVDQVGSRLLFRGYGVSDSMRPLHAGLLGMDTLLLLDEAHIAEPFCKTLEGIVREQRASEIGEVGPRPLRWVQLSATQRDAGGAARSFSLAPEDREHESLRERLRAKKPLRLEEVERRSDLSRKMVELVKEELSAAPLTKDEAARIAVIVNRVATARALFESFQKQFGGTAEVELLIGRTRPIDRDLLMERLNPKLSSQRELLEAEGRRPIIVVATQTIEVGADFDFHALYTEAASYPALLQRVGRLNRLGRRKASRGAIVLVRAEAKGDPVYGDTIAATWKLLKETATDGVVDLGPEAAPAPPADCIPASPPTPTLSPPLLALLTQTCPEPAVSPEVAEFLHGFDASVPDVTVVWREGIEGQKGIDAAAAEAILSVLPPLSLEGMSLSYSTFRQWVRSWEDARAKIGDAGDLDGEPPASSGRDLPGGTVLLVKGDKVEAVPAHRVPPGTLVVVPSSRGGADAYGFHPEHRGRVRDLSLTARLRRREAAGKAGRRGRAREAILPFTPELVRGWLAAGSADSSQEKEWELLRKDLEQLLQDPEGSLDDALALVGAWFDEHLETMPADVKETWELLQKEERVEWLHAGGQRIGVVFREKRPRGGDLFEGASLQRTVRVPLEAHLRGVGAIAGAYAKAVGLPPNLVTALRLAGALHDLGKAEPRFQRRLGATEKELLAKSDEYDPSVPRGERHEAYSVAILDRHPELLEEAGEERDLVRYLVGTHHGHGRALHPAREDEGVFFEFSLGGRSLLMKGRPGLDGITSGWPELFTALNRRYGPWLLAYMEALLRLADHRRSELELEGGLEEGR